jgi:putative endonuclease
MTIAQDLGREGETIASTFLIEKGFSIKEKNWRFRNDEIDIIAENTDFVVVVEVKTRSGNYFGDPEIFVNKTKQKNLIRAAQAYIEKFNIDKEIRFDIVSIIKTKDKVVIDHIESAFYPTL